MLPMISDNRVDLTRFRSRKRWCRVSGSSLLVGNGQVVDVRSIFAFDWDARGRGSWKALGVITVGENQSGNCSPEDTANGRCTIWTGTVQMTGRATPDFVVKRKGTIMANEMPISPPDLVYKFDGKKVR